MEPREIDTTALQGLAHPLRVRIFDELNAHGPATSSELARRFGESSGATSYHLRQLARHGFVEEVADRGTSRERWWRVPPGRIRLEADAMRRDSSAAVREAAQVVLSEWHRGRTERAAYWQATTTTWPREWVAGSLVATTHLRLRADEMAELSDELNDVLSRWNDAMADRLAAEPAEDTYMVEVQIDVFPLEPPRRHDGLTSSPPDHSPGPPA